MEWREGKGEIASKICRHKENVKIVLKIRLSLKIGGSFVIYFILG